MTQPSAQKKGAGGPAPENLRRSGRLAAAEEAEGAEAKDGEGGWLWHWVRSDDRDVVDVANEAVRVSQELDRARAGCGEFVAVSLGGVAWLVALEVAAEGGSVDQEVDAAGVPGSARVDVEADGVLLADLGGKGLLNSATGLVRGAAEVEMLGLLPEVAVAGQGDVTTGRTYDFPTGQAGRTNGVVRGAARQGVGFESAINYERCLSSKRENEGRRGKSDSSNKLHV